VRAATTPVARLESALTHGKAPKSSIVRVHQEFRRVDGDLLTVRGWAKPVKLLLAPARSVLSCSPGAVSSFVGDASPETLSPRHLRGLASRFGGTEARVRLPTLAGCQHIETEPIAATAPNARRAAGARERSGCRRRGGRLPTGVRHWHRPHLTRPTQGDTPRTQRECPGSPCRWRRTLLASLPALLFPEHSHRR